MNIKNGFVKNITNLLSKQTALLAVIGLTALPMTGCGGGGGGSSVEESSNSAPIQATASASKKTKKNNKGRNTQDSNNTPVEDSNTPPAEEETSPPVEEETSPPVEESNNPPTGGNYSDDTHQVLKTNIDIKVVSGPYGYDEQSQQKRDFRMGYRDQFNGLFTGQSDYIFSCQSPFSSHAS